MTRALRLGAVAYDPKVVTIWDGFRVWLRQRGLDFDYVLYSNYERQVEELVAGSIDVAWNSPLAWVRTRRMVPSARSLVMRDTDQDLVSVIVVPVDSPTCDLRQLEGATVGVGAIDSPQATLLPLALIGDTPITVRRFDIGVGLHGDHIGGERDAARALSAGEVDAACMSDSTHLMLSKEGTLPAGSTRILAHTPPYDHCNMTATGESPESLGQFVSLLLEMDYADPSVRPLLDLEGLTRWLPGRTLGYVQLEAAADRFGFYDQHGKVTVDDYEP
jgi:ABC-type phosphate/phosphonate transport system substrate-binding protein